MGGRRRWVHHHDSENSDNNSGSIVSKLDIMIYSVYGNGPQHLGMASLRAVVLHLTDDSGFTKRPALHHESLNTITIHTTPAL